VRADGPKSARSRSEGRRRAGTRRLRTGLAWGATAGYAAALAATTPFTLAADVLTAVALAALALGAARTLVRSSGPAADRAGLRPLAPWVALAVAVVGWELGTYFAGAPRADHPTFSSMADAVDRTFVLKMAMGMAWLGLGRRLARPAPGSNPGTP